jgi:hypothetical protein
VGTLGCIVIDNATNAEMLLSNFHVMCVDDGWRVGDQMCQPSRVDGGHCPADVVGSLQRAALTDQVDAAVADHTARGHQCSILDIGDVAGTATATVGMAVRKRGRTTELTYGTVDTVDLTVTIDYCNGLGVRTLFHQIGIEPDKSENEEFGTGGDSGSVVVNAGRRVVGLYFAGDDTGYGVANPIDEVLTELDVSICIRKPWDIKAHDIKAKDHDIKAKDHDIKKQEVDIKKPEKEMVETRKPQPETGIGQPPVDPATAQPATGSALEERVARLEAALAQLTHFIRPQSRPDIDKAALQNEADYGRR